MHLSKVVVMYALVASVLMGSTVLALLTIQKTIHGTGSIKGIGIGVYWDLQCTNATSSLDFGQVEPGSSKIFSLYLRNEGNSAVTLSMTSENWNPANATDYMTLTWNREGQSINPGEVLGFVITLSVSENAQGFSSFAFDIIISGTG